MSRTPKGQFDRKRFPTRLVLITQTSEWLEYHVGEVREYFEIEDEYGRAYYIVGDPDNHYRQHSIVPIKRYDFAHIPDACLELAEVLFGT